MATVLNKRKTEIRTLDSRSGGELTEGIVERVMQYGPYEGFVSQVDTHRLFSIA
jgi:hypothetical protein